MNMKSSSMVRTFSDTFIALWWAPNPKA